MVSISNNQDEPTDQYPVFIEYLLDKYENYSIKYHYIDLFEISDDEIRGLDIESLKNLYSYLSNSQLDNTIISQINMYKDRYIDYIIKNNPDVKIDWTNQLKKVHHYDMNEDVIKSAGLEFLCLTGVLPNMEKPGQNAIIEQKLAFDAQFAKQPSQKEE